MWISPPIPTTLQQNLDSAVHIITKIINLSLKHGEVPNVLKEALVKVQMIWWLQISFGCNSNPMLLVLDNSDSPSIVEQLSQGPSLVYNTFISDRFLALDLSYALFLASCSMDSPMFLIVPWPYVPLSLALPFVTASRIRITLFI